MPKEIPDCPTKPTPALEAVHHYEIELVTPMFGGGIEPRVNDSTFPIRPTAIRGQLQFWWRATVGAQCATLAELRTAQTKVWGSTERASRVQVRVENVKTDTPSPCASIDWDQNARRGQGGWRTNWKEPFDGRGSELPYALFPFQGETPPPNRNATVTVPPASCIRRASFQLTLSSDRSIDFAREVEPAIWAWINFGGLGSRTRRGCGAITCKEFAPKDTDDFKAALGQYLPELFPQRDWPTLAETVLVDREFPSSIEAWNRIVDRFRHFRQGVNMGRNPRQQTNHPGRSRYSEPETIRRILSNPNHPWAHGRLDHIPDDAFPRAELGLPIVFHFQGQGEPPDTVLYPSAGPGGQKRERMASPLILKPLALQNGKAIPLILRLRTPGLASVDLRHGEVSLNLPPTTTIRDSRLSNYQNSPLQGSPAGSALEAFLEFAQSEGFKEVPR